MTEPEDVELSITATEALTVLVVGLSVACTAYGVGRVRRFLKRLDPTSDFRDRIRTARDEYTLVREAWLHLGLFGPTVKRVSTTRTRYRGRRAAVGEVTRTMRGAMREVRSIGGSGATGR